MTTLGLVCSFLNGGTPSRGVARYYQGDVPWITSADIRGPRADTARSFITEEAIRDSATNRVPAGTVLLVTRTGIGKVALAAIELCFSQDITAITPDPRFLDRSYLVHFLRTKQPHLERLARGATIKGVTRKAVANLVIPLPPLAEQKRITEVLDVADALKAKRREALDQLDTLIQSIFLDMFGDPVTNPRGWEVRELSRTKSTVQIGPFGSLLHKQDYVVDGVPLVNPMHIVGGEIHVGNEQTVSERKAAALSSYRLQAGDVVMGRRGEMGRCAIVSDCEAGMLCGTGSLFIRPHPDELSSPFLANTLSSESMQRVLEGLSQGVTMPNLNRTMLEGLKVALPPLDLQGRFAAIVRSVERHKASLRAHLAELDTLFASLQARAFRGDL